MASSDAAVSAMTVIIWYKGDVDIGNLTFDTFSRQSQIISMYDSIT